MMQRLPCSCLWVQRISWKRPLIGRNPVFRPDHLCKQHERSFDVDAARNTGSTTARQVKTNHRLTTRLGECISHTQEHNVVKAAESVTPGCSCLRNQPAHLSATTDEPRQHVLPLQALYERSLLVFVSPTDDDTPETTTRRFFEWLVCVTNSDLPLEGPCTLHCSPPKHQKCHDSCDFASATSQATALLPPSHHIDMSDVGLALSDIFFW